MNPIHQCFQKISPGNHFSYVKKHAICLKDYRIRSFLSIRQAHGDLCKHLGIDSSTYLDDRYSNLFLNAYIKSRLVLESIPECLHK